MHSSYLIFSQLNHYKTEGPCTSSNHVEGWDLQLKKVARKAYPNIYEQIRVINKEKALITMQVRQLVADTSEPPSQPPTPPTRRDRDRKIQTLFQRLELGTITLGDYLMPLNIIQVFDFCAHSSSHSTVQKKVLSRVVSETTHSTTR